MNHSSASSTEPNPQLEFFARIQRELMDEYDEELEMEMEDEIRPPENAEEAADQRRFRHLYFRELFRLQGELVKLQEWVVESGHKLVILFEGRDAAGKGGTIKRITQRLNPRVCRVAALPAPNNRERTQWYYQRYVAHLPARSSALTAAGITVRVSNVSWASVPTRSMRSFSAASPSSKSCSSAPGSN